MDINRLLNFSSNVGKILLQSGAETYRVEETISRICKSFKVDEVDVFATPTAVIVSVLIDGKIHSVVKRISSRGTDLNKVHNINSLSRRINQEHLSIDDCELQLEQLCKEDFYSRNITLLAAGTATSAFALLFGGTIEDIIVSFIVGVLVKIIIMILSKSSLNEFFINSICGAFIAICSLLFLHYGIIKEINKVIAGSIMLLVPGLSLTISLRELIEGQLISGLTKVAEVFFVGVAIAVGTGLVLHFYLKVGGHLL